MAGHWIKWEKGLTRKPEVLRMARELGVTPEHAAACCMKVWEWADDCTLDGLVSGVTVEDVDTAAGVAGIGRAMLHAGWLVVSESCVQFPNYDRHNGDTGKRRALDAMRKRARRAEDKLRTSAGRTS